jgi:hypothetical protein
MNKHKRTFVGPKAAFESYIPIAPDLANRIMTFQTQLFVWGWITYDDIFGSHHRTEYCLRYKGYRKLPDNTVIWDSEQCAAHNCADKDCGKKWCDNISIDCENVTK